MLEASNFLCAVSKLNMYLSILLSQILQFARKDDTWGRHMERKDSTALVAVPTASTAIALRKSKQDSKLLLADGDVVLTNREEVRNRLPDILGHG